MAKREHIDAILAGWPYEPGEVMARRVQGKDGRELVQMRVDMGILQMESEGRPDGAQPEGSATYYHHLVAQALSEGEEFELSTEQCEEVDREFVQFYHRRVCWLALREFERALRDADHTLALMDFSTAHAPDEQWALSHEQYRPFVLFHRTQAAALAALDDESAEEALDAIDGGLKQFQALFEEHGASEHFEEDEMVGRLREMKESIREHYELGRTLREKLAEAVDAEEYERAARIRDEIARRKSTGPGGPSGPSKPA